MKKGGPKTPKQKPSEADEEQARREKLPKEIQAKILAGFYRPADLENYSKTFQLYLRGKAVAWQEAKLEKIGWIKLENSGGKPDPGKSHDPDDICETHIALAKRMELHYQNADGSNKLKIKIDKGIVGEWAHGRSLGERQIWPPGAIPGAKRKWSLKAWIAWFDETLLSRHLADPLQTAIPGSPAEDDPLVLRQRVDRQKMLDVLFESDRLRGQYISMALAENVFAGEMRLFLNLAREIIEKNPPETFEAFAQTLNVEPEKVAALKEFVRAAGRRMVDELVAAGLKRAKETAKQLKPAPE